MHITDVKVKLAPRSEDKLLGFASVTFDGCFVVRDIKVIQGAAGLFVAMPSRKMTDRCAYCGAKNHIQAAYCNHCGKRQPERTVGTDTRGRAKYHADIAHPISTRCRQELQDAILKGYHAELARSRQPGYLPTDLDDGDEGLTGNAAARAPAGPGEQQSTASVSGQPPAAPNRPTPSPLTSPPSPAKPPGEERKDSGFGMFA